MTVKVLPAMVIVPSRRGPLFADTRHCTVLLPLPLAPDVIVIHGALLTAVQAHPAGAVTLTGSPDPASSSTVSFDGEIEYVHGAACDTVNVWLAIVKLAVRALPVRWIAQEAPGVVPGTGEVSGEGSWGEHFVLSLDGRALAHTAPHGGRIDWLPGAG